jgi:hypothetical protein
VQRKWMFAAVGLPVLLALWWAFRPEKLWINQKVNEAPPFETSADPQPILTGRFESKAQPTTGRATVYQTPGGAAFLRLSDLATRNGEDLHVELEDNLHRSDLGTLKSNTGDQTYYLPAATDLKRYDAAVIYSERSRTVFGVAKLEPF